MIAAARLIRVARTERDFSILVLARAVSTFGSAFAPIALAFAVIHLTGSPCRPRTGGRSGDGATRRLHARRRRLGRPARTWVWSVVVQFGLINAFGMASFLVLGPFVAQRSLGGALAWSGIVAAQSVG